MLQPKRTKYRKTHKSRNRGLAFVANKVSFGEFGLKATGIVLDHLFGEASRYGTPAVRGRLESWLLPALWERPCLLLRETRDLVHTRDPQLLEPIRLGEALFTPMDGEAWMGHHLDPVPGVGA